ncbi:hypothetical protein QJQ45_028060 [Haematococcus lacustris]|nr:hypothetical protein QJQ45_028060 [Haematococcus lacustris]
MLGDSLPDHIFDYKIDSGARLGTRAVLRQLRIAEACICDGLTMLFSMAKKKRRTVPRPVPEDPDSDIEDRDEALQPDLTEAQQNRKVSGEARAARDRDNTYHGRKCKIAHLIDHLPQELWDAFLADAVQPRVEAISERGVLASLLLGLLVRGLFTIRVADPLGLHDQPVYTDIPVSQAAIPDLSCRNLYLQLCRGPPGNGANTRPNAAVAAVLAAHPDLRDRLAAIPRHLSDTNMVDHVGKQLETAFSNMLTLLFAGRLKKSVSLAGAKVLLGTEEHRRRFGFWGVGGGHLPAWSKRACTYVRRMVCGLDVSWLLEQGGVVPTPAMQAEVALQRGLLGLEEGERVDDDWVEDPVNRGRLLRHAVHTTREMEAAMAAWQLDMVPWQQAELTNPGLLPRPPRPPTPYALTPTSKCQARHVFIDTKGLYGMMHDAGMLGVLTEAGVTSFKKFRNGALPDPAVPGNFIAGPKDSHVANRWDALLPDPRRQKLASPKHNFAQIVHTDGVAISVMFLRPKPAAPPAELPRMGRGLGAVNPLAHLHAEWLGVDPGKTNMATVAHEERSAAGTVISVRHWKLTAGQYYRDSGITRQAQATKTWLTKVKPQLTALSRVSSKPSSLASYRRFADTVLETYDAMWAEVSKKRWANAKFRLYCGKMRVVASFWAKVKKQAQKRWPDRILALAYGAASFSGSGSIGCRGVPVSQMRKEAVKQFGAGRVVLVDEFRTSRVSSAYSHPIEALPGQPPESFRWLRPVYSKAKRSQVRGLMSSTSYNIRFYDRDVSAALNIRRCAVGPGPRPTELCYWDGRPAMPKPGRPGQEWVYLRDKALLQSFPPLDDLKIRSSLTVPRALQCGAMQGRIVQAGQTRLNAGLMRRSHRACRTRLSAAVYLNAATDTVRLPLQPQQLLGLEPNKDHKDSDVNQVYDELILSLTEQGYSEQTATSRAELLEIVRRDVITSKGRASSRSEVSIPLDLVPGALALMAEVGQDELVMTLGNELLGRGELDEYMELKKDVLLSMAVAKVNMARDVFQTPNQIATGCRHLEEALQLLQSGSATGQPLAPELSREVRVSLAELRSQCALEQRCVYADSHLFFYPPQVSGSLRPDQQDVRKRAVRTIRELLRPPAGTADASSSQAASSVPPEFVAKLVEQLTCEELVLLLEWDTVARNPGAYNWLYPGLLEVVAAAHIVTGYLQCQPAYIRMATNLLRKLGSSPEVLAAQAVCSVLLGSVQVALDTLQAAEAAGSRSPTPSSPKPGSPRQLTSPPSVPSSQAFSWVRSHTPTGEDGLLTGLCAFTELWLGSAALPLFRDTAAASSSHSLTAYFDDARVEAFLSVLEEPQSSQTAAAAAGLIVSQAPLLFAQMRRALGSMQEGAAANLTSLATSAAAGLEASGGLGQPGSNKGSLAAAAVGVLAVGVLVLLKAGAPARQQAQVSVVTTSAAATSQGGAKGGPTASRPAAPAPTDLTPKAVDQLVRSWQEVKQAALGASHDASALSSLLVDPLLGEMTARVASFKADGWFMKYKLHKLKVLDIDTSHLSSSGGFAIAAVQLDESATLCGQAGAPEEQYRSAYVAKYQVVKGKAGAWRIAKVIIEGDQAL